ncbi:MAG: hypothetical protein P1U50_00605 [Parvibaculaceae bacterium]|nr:hypothetical protein [Parvibaculaceae bacterium]
MSIAAAMQSVRAIEAVMFKKCKIVFLTLLSGVNPYWVGSNKAKLVPSGLSESGVR